MSAASQEQVEPVRLRHKLPSLPPPAIHAQSMKVAAVGLGAPLAPSAIIGAMRVRVIVVDLSPSGTRVGHGPAVGPRWGREPAVSSGQPRCPADSQTRS
jgi:hypothetical protein